MKKLDLKITRVIEILLRALDYIDVRLVDHGHRVSYIVYKMMQMDGTFREKELQEICIVVALHDIGAYKTEEIDHMMGFETTNVFDHSIYGHLFLKHMSPLAKWSEIVLYHHLDYEHHNRIDCDLLKIADMVHLADRMDLMLQKKERWLSCEELEKQKELRFGKETIELFRKANEAYDIEGNIMNGGYLRELGRFVATAEYGDLELMEFFKMIAYSIDFRSETTVSHVISTVSISEKLAELFSLDQNEMEKIQLGAYLHDIGKIATPLEILEKPGGLTHDEMVIMKEHIDITGRILKDRINDEVRRIAYRHHEKIDGTGYPLKLNGDQLSLNDKIVAVADVMSALTGKRSYKEGFSKEVVVGILQQQKDSGKLSGEVIDKSIRHYDEIMEQNNEKIAYVTDIYYKINREFNQIKRRFEE